MGWQRYEHTQGSSNKFWEIRRRGREVTTRWGRIGNKPQSNKKSYATDRAARDAMFRIISKKVDKGYVLVTEAGVPQEKKRPREREQTFIERLQRKVQEKWGDDA